MKNKSRKFNSLLAIAFFAASINLQKSNYVVFDEYKKNSKQQNVSIMKCVDVGKKFGKDKLKRKY